MKPYLLTDENAIDTSQEGFQHIRVGSYSLTLLGRFLANSYRMGFVHPTYGKFASMENYWYFVRGGCTNYRLAECSAMALNRLKLREPKFEYEDTTTFRARVIEGLRCKIFQNVSIEVLMKDSALKPLPFARYHINRSEGLIEVDAEQPWFFEAVDEIRRSYVKVKGPS